MNRIYLSLDLSKNSTDSRTTVLPTLSALSPFNQSSNPNKNSLDTGYLVTSTASSSSMFSTFPTKSSMMMTTTTTMMMMNKVTDGLYDSAVKNPTPLSSFGLELPSPTSRIGFSNLTSNLTSFDLTKSLVKDEKSISHSNYESNNYLTNVTNSEIAIPSTGSHRRGRIKSRRAFGKAGSNKIGSNVTFRDNHQSTNRSTKGELSFLKLKLSSSLFYFLF